MPGRWHLPRATPALPYVADMYSVVDSMYNNYVSATCTSMPHALVCRTLFHYLMH